MGPVVAEISISVDGFVAGPNASLEEGLGRDGEKLHEWAVASRAWNEAHGRGGGEESPDDEFIEEGVAAGATVMGRRMFSGGEGPWDEDPNGSGWWGDEPPFHHPVFVLTHHPREPLTLGETTFTFVTDGVESAVEQAREAAGEDRVTVAGGGNTIRQALAAGLVDELRVHVAPVLLGDGARLIDHLDGSIDLEQTRVVHSPAVTHVIYAVR